MAQSNNYFGLRRGSTKTATYTIRHGKQITKDRVYDVTNPQSTAQMAQRVKIPLVAQARVILSTLIDHSFEGVDYGEASLNMFSSLNLKKDALTVAAYIPKGAEDTGEANFIISKGTLTCGAPVFSSGDYNITFPDQDITNVKDDYKLYDKVKALKVGDYLPQFVFDYLMARWSWLQERDQLTVLAGYHADQYSWTVDSTTYSAYRHKFVVARIIMDSDNEITHRWTCKQALAEPTTDDDGNETEMQQCVFTDGYIDFVPLVFDEEDGLPSQNPYFVINTNVTAEKNTCMATFIRSKIFDKDRYLRSTSRFVVKTGQNITADMVLPTYQNSSTTTTNYLNSGTDSVSVTGGST